MISLNAKQNEVFRKANEFEGRYRIFMGSAGSGKSVNVAQDYILKLGDPKYKGANLLVVRKTDVNHRTSTYAELTSAIYRIYGRYADLFWQVKQSPLEIKNKKTGNSIIFRGVADERQRERLKSITAPNDGKITWIWCEEATELLKNDFDVLDTRLRGELINPNLYYQITVTFNPVSAVHWLKSRFFDQPDDDTFLSHSTYLDNAFIDKAYYKMMQRLAVTNPEYYKIYGLGEWGETGGLILTNFEIREFDKRSHMFDAMAFGTDWGYNHPHATLLLGYKDDTVYICDELYVRNKDTNQIVELAAKQFSKYRQFRMYCDSAEPDRIKTFVANGWNAVAAKKGSGSVLAQIDWLQGRKIIIHPDCVNTAKEMQQWKWLKDRKTDEYTDEPVNFKDDAMAALRYGIEPWRIGPAVKSIGRKPRGF